MSAERTRISLALLTLVAAVACGGSSDHHLKPCTGTTSAQCTGALAGLNYTNYVHGFMVSSCNICHDGAGAIDLRTYSTAAANAAAIDCRAGMNPSGSPKFTDMGDASVTDLDRQKLACWVAVGAPQ